jgi:hypothetical protein
MKRFVPALLAASLGWVAYSMVPARADPHEKPAAEKGHMACCTLYVTCCELGNRSFFSKTAACCVKAGKVCGHKGEPCGDKHHGAHCGCCAGESGHGEKGHGEKDPKKTEEKK